MAPLGAIFISVKRWYVTRPLCLAQPIKRNTRRAVRHIHDAGTLKPRLNTRTLHGQVVLMRVDAQVIGRVEASGRAQVTIRKDGAEYRYTK